MHNSVVFVGSNSCHGSYHISRTMAASIFAPCMNAKLEQGIVPSMLLICWRPTYAATVANTYSLLRVLMYKLIGVQTQDSTRYLPGYLHDLSGLKMN